MNFIGHKRIAFRFIQAQKYRPLCRKMDHLTIGGRYKLYGLSQNLLNVSLDFWALAAVKE